MLELSNISKAYADKPLLTDISFTVSEGETVCLLGASGSGKSTLLRMIAGLEPPDAGVIAFDGVDIAATPPHLRDFGLVFQDYALFPHLDVQDNIAFGLKMRRIDQLEIDERVATMLHMVNLDGFENRRVADLSGGEQQRVALARAFAIHPRLLMFDEPLGALDRTLRENLLNELRTILRKANIPAIYVTHDQDEAFALADRVLILYKGRIIRDGTPQEVWEDPGSSYAATFLGLGNVISGEVVGRVKSRGWKVKSKVGEFVVRCTHRHSNGDKIHLLARSLEAETARVDRNGAETEMLTGTVTDIVFQQDKYKVTFDNGLYAYLSEAPKVGQKISVRVQLECLA